MLNDLKSGMTLPRQPRNVLRAGNCGEFSNPTGFGRAVLALLCLLVACFSCPTQATEPSTEPILRIEAGMHTAMIHRIVTDTAGRYAVTTSDDKTARVWDVGSSQLLRVLRPPIGSGDEGKLYAAAISPDGSTVAVAGSTGGEWNSQFQIYLFDRQTGQLEKRLTGLPYSASNIVNELGFSPDGRWLAASLAIGNSGVFVWDWRQGGKAITDSESEFTNLIDGSNFSWSADGRLAVTSLDRLKLRLYRVQDGVLVKLNESVAPGGKLSRIKFSPNGRSLAVSHVIDNRIDVLDGESLAFQFAPNTQGTEKGTWYAIDWSRDSQTLVAGGRWNINDRALVRSWSLSGRGLAVDTPTVKGSITSLSSLPKGGWLLGGDDPSWGVISANGVWQEHARSPTVPLNNVARDALMLNTTGRQVQFGYGGDKLKMHFDVTQRQLIVRALPGGVGPRTTQLPIENWRYSQNDPMINGKPLKLSKFSYIQSVGITHDSSGFVLGTNNSLNFYTRDGQRIWERAFPSYAWTVNIPSTDKFVVATCDDGTIRWHRLSDGQELLALFVHADRKRWVLWTPSGYYDASPGAEELIGWHVNRGQDQAADFFPASRFRSKFYRPDVIDRVLDTLDEVEALKQADLASNRRHEAPVSVAQILPPVVDLVSSGEVSTGSVNVTIQVKGRSTPDAPVTGWRVRVNGLAISEARGLQRNQTEREIMVTIPAQDSEIQVFAENRHGVSTPATVRVRWTGQVTAADAGQGKAKLYVLAVGVSNYQHKDISKLGLPAKDANDFVAALQRQKGKLYRDVEVRLLTDDKATADAVIDGLEWLQKQVTAQDVGVVFVAGHGVNDPDLGYTYLPANADPDRLRRTGVTMDEFKKTMAKLPGKALFFFDTCHSGNVLGSKLRAVSDVSGVINEMASAENGIVVFSSSTGRQLSYEDVAWGNGAFTKALVEGIDGAAEYRQSGRITHKMLDLYISERVMALTSGKQSPVTQAPGGVPDYSVAVK